MRIVKAELEHLEDVCALSEKFFAYLAAQESCIYQKAKANREHFRKSIARDDNLFVVAYDLDVPVGFCHVVEKTTSSVEFYVDHRFAVLMELFIVSAYRGSDVSNRLMAEAKKWTKARDLDYLELRVLNLDDFSTRLYEQEGFDITQHTMRCLMK